MEEARREWEIRPFCEKDYPEILELYRTLYGAMAALSPKYMLPGEQDEEFLDAVRESREDDILVAVRGERVLGFAMVQTGITPPYPCIEEYQFGCLMELMVREEERNHGIGTALMKAAEQWCRDQGLSYLEVDVLAANGGARRLYQRHGYCDEVITLRRWLGEE